MASPELSPDLLQRINNDLALQGLLYDLNLLPEVVMSRDDPGLMAKMVLVAETFRLGREAQKRDSKAQEGA